MLQTSPRAHDQQQPDSGEPAATSVDDLLAGLRAAGEPTRLRLLALCARAELTATELTRILHQSQPRVSRHLKLLHEAGLLDRFREGPWAFYRLAGDGDGDGLALALVRLIPRGDPTIARDLQRLEDVRRARAETAAAYFRANAARWNEIRSLYVPEAEVERALLDIFADKRIEDFLDVGTGTGRILEVFADRIDRGTGIDLSHEMLAFARANLEQPGTRHCQVRHGDMYALPIEDGSIDAAVFHQVLHFAEEPAAALAEAARVLRPDGRLVIVDFAPHDVEFLRAEHAHLRLGLEDAEVRNWCRQAGLDGRLAKQLPGSPLTVNIWVAAPAVAAARRSAGRASIDER